LIKDEASLKKTEEEEFIDTCKLYLIDSKRTLKVAGSNLFNKHHARLLWKAGEEVDGKEISKKWSGLEDSVKQKYKHLAEKLTDFLERKIKLEAFIVYVKDKKFFNDPLKRIVQEIKQKEEAQKAKVKSVEEEQISEPDASESQKKSSNADATTNANAEIEQPAQVIVVNKSDMSNILRQKEKRTAQNSVPC
jgi:hypothetical protein